MTQEDLNKINALATEIVKQRKMVETLKSVRDDFNSPDKKTAKIVIGYRGITIDSMDMTIGMVRLLLEIAEKELAELQEEFRKL